MEMPEIKLTLAPAPAPEAPEVIVEEKPLTQPEEMQPVFTPEEQQMIAEFAKQIDIRDVNLVFQYGAGAQQNIANFSDTALNNVKAKDLGEVAI